MSEVIIDYNMPGGYLGIESHDTPIYDADNWNYQTITPEEPIVFNSIEMYFYKMNDVAGVGTIDFGIYAVDGDGLITGDAITTASINVDDLEYIEEWDNDPKTTITFNDSYTATSQFAVLWKLSSSEDGENVRYYHGEGEYPAYSGGKLYLSFDAGSYWYAPIDYFREENASAFFLITGSSPATYTPPIGHDIHIGLKYSSKLMPMRPVTSAEMMASTVTVKKIGISVLNTDDITVGILESDMKDVSFADMKNKSTITGLYTGTVEVSVPDGYSKNLPLQIITDSPLPATIRAMIPKMDMTGGR